jgi:hypothetical protein
MLLENKTAIVYGAAGASLPPEYRARALNGEVPTWATREAVRAEVLFSPLAGIARWAVPEG